MLRNFVLLLIAVMALNGCVGWMFHDSDMGRGHPGRRMGYAAPPGNPEEPCRGSGSRWPGERPCQ